MYLGLLLLTVDRMLLISAAQNATAPTAAHHDLSGLSLASDDDLMLMACDLPQPQLPAPTNAPLQPQLLPAPHAGGQNEPWGFGGPQSSLTQLPATGKQAGYLLLSSLFEAQLLSFSSDLCLEGINFLHSAYFHSLGLPGWC